jgi:UDP-N-acetylglucosamine transferase subunit ALG13
VIFVITGMEIHPFDRLARTVDELHRTRAVGEDFLIQLGSCTFEPRHVPFVRYLSFGEICDRIREASVVITHAGAGSTLVTLQQGKHPVVVPRLARFGEHVDDHQLGLAEKLASRGLVTVVRDEATLAGAIEAARCADSPAHFAGRASALTSWLDEFWRRLEAAQSGPSAP